MNSSSSAFSVYISEKKQIVIATLIGELDRSSAASLSRCVQEIAERRPRWVVLNLRDVPGECEPELIPLLVKIQAEIRALPAELRLSSLHPELKKEWLERGIVRHEELHDNLAVALQSLSVKIAA